MSPADWATLSLTAATLVVAVLAVVIGIGAIFGWQVMRDGAKAAGAKAGQTAAEKAMEAHIQTDAFREMVRSHAEGIVKGTILDHLLTKGDSAYPPSPPTTSPERLKD